jgi:hypothetical protein
MGTILLAQAFLYAKPRPVSEETVYVIPPNVVVTEDENEGSTLQRGTLIVQVFDAHSPEIEAKVTSMIKRVLESM